MIIFIHSPCAIMNIFIPSPRAIMKTEYLPKLYPIISSREYWTQLVIWHQACSSSLLHSDGYLINVVPCLCRDTSTHSFVLAPALMMVRNSCLVSNYKRLIKSEFSQTKWQYTFTNYHEHCEYSTNDRAWTFPVVSKILFVTFRLQLYYSLSGA